VTVKKGPVEQKKTDSAIGKTKTWSWGTKLTCDFNREVFMYKSTYFELKAHQLYEEPKQCRGLKKIRKKPAGTVERTFKRKKEKEMSSKALLWREKLTFWSRRLSFKV